MNKAMNQPGLIGLSVAVVCIGMMMAATARASILAKAYYELGEADTSAAPHTPPHSGDGGGAITVDSSGHGFDLTESGSPTYSSNVPLGIGSSLSMQFNANSDSYSRPTLIPSNTDEAIIEAWAEPTASDFGDGVFHVVAIAGDFVIGVFQNYWSFLEQGHSFNQDVPAVVNQWVDIKLDLDLLNGHLTGYVGGVPVAINTINPGSSASGTFQIGGNFVGNIDEVTVLTPEPASVGLLAIGGLVLLRRRRA